MQTQHSGQVALIMVLIMTVLSAIAVSIAGRSTIETRNQTLSLANKEAFLTAQAGLEEAVSKNLAVSGEGYVVTKNDLGSNSLTTDKINPGEVFEVYLVGANGVTGINVYWKKAVSGKPAVFITDVRSDRNIDYAYDADGANGFTQVVAGGTLAGVSYDYVTPVAIPIAVGNSTVLRITVLGSPAFLGIEPVGGTLPVQMTDYRSIASLDSGTTLVKYGIEYKESKTNQLPSIFDYVLFSGGTIIQ